MFDANNIIVKPNLVESIYSYVYEFRLIKTRNNSSDKIEDYKEYIKCVGKICFKWNFFISSKQKFVCSPYFIYKKWAVKN